MSSAPTSRGMHAFNMVAYVVLLTGLPFWVWYCLIAVTEYGGALVVPDAAFWSHVQPRASKASPSTRAGSRSRRRSTTSFPARRSKGNRSTTALGFRIA